MKKPLLTFVLAATALILTAVSRANTVYVIGSNGSSLVSFDHATPGITTVVGTFSGAALQLDGIDFNPSNGLLYGYSQLSNAVVSINLTSALTTLVSTPTFGSATRTLGIDFNPVADRLRLVNVDDQNLRIAAVTGVTTVDGALAYGAGDPNFGANPAIADAAYTNSDTNPATGTTLYYIDSALGSLVSTSNPNGGILNTIGSLGVTTTSSMGFDILSDGLGGNTLYALLTSTTGTPSFYTVNPTTGAATLVGAINAIRPYGLAIAPNSSVPDSGSSAGLLVLVLAGVTLIRRRLNVAAE